ncbi:discoidin domain-containing protein [Streptococcus sp. E17BB]|uniref:discoidin domain-containing protein n=1 Tax=Streptococcus sp. E17BB TaxID=3278714 RepID=UPI00359DD622
MKKLFDKQNKYGIRKLSIGVCSAVIGLSLLGAQTAYATEASEPSSQPNSAGAATPAVETPEPVMVDSAYAEASSSKENAPATNAVDADINTYWESAPTGDGEATTLTVKMSEVATVDKVTYTPRQVTTQDPSSPNPKHHAGLLTKGQIDYSLNGTDWEPVAPTRIDGDSTGRGVANEDKTFSLGANNNTRVINFQPVKAQYLRLTALESWANNLPARSGVVTAAQFIPSCVKPIEETPQV